jgi:hypothetical protein
VKAKKTWPFPLAAIAVLLAVYLIFSQSPAEVCTKTFAAAQNETLQECLQDWSSETVAVYTKILAALTIVLAAISGLQIYFLSLADATARISATSAKESADTARDTLIATNRPLLTLVIEPIEDLQAQDDGVKFGIKLSTENSGGSPAVDVAIGLNFVGRMIPAEKRREALESFSVEWRGSFEPDLIFQRGTRTHSMGDFWPRPADGDDDAEFVAWISYGMLLDERRFYTAFFFRPIHKVSGQDFLDPDYRGRADWRNIRFARSPFIT